ncbi:hypothetical protein [Bacillus alkalicellulosilyticus]|uniref:hypothetical protein n=1 Tax=Alkalihalobacterium alkalicellulosilyticum TaxID=1912214 RepID=UPI0009988C9E|nr:hypothetical protein [Bacillus alkalicellulosilyticus]
MVNKKFEIEEAYKQQVIALYWLLGISIISFIGLQVSRTDLFILYSYSLHEIVSATANLMFLVPIAILVYVYFGIKYLKVRGIGFPKIKTAIKAIIVTSLITVMCGISIYQLNEVTTSGVLLVTDKKQEETKYYVTINDTKVRVTENEFYLITVDEQYMGSYRWNSLSPEKGKLLTIEPI